MTEREALKMAIEFLEDNQHHVADNERHAYVMEYNSVIEMCKEALAQPGQQPVAFYVYKPTLPRGNLGNVSDGDLPWVYDQDPSSGYSARMLVYTSPPHWKPLTDEEIDVLVMDSDGTPNSHLEFARAIEAKLKEKNT